jgi:hypothetical protein
MRLRRVRIAGFRRLVEPLEVADLDDGITVLGGDNEFGKSTWLEAVRTALFDRHTLSGKAAESLQPDGQRIAPEITLEFETAGAGWTLFKRFCQRPAAELSGPAGERYTGDAAEDRLQALLGFERPSRGPSEIRHHGIYGLLWLTQGTAHLDTRPAEAARRMLGNALEAEVGDVLGGGLGQQLLDDLATERDRFWTATGKPSKALRQAIEAVQRLEAEQAEAQSALESYRRMVTDLEKVEQHYRRLQETGELLRQTRRRDAARAAHEQLQEARRRQQQAVADHRVAEAEQQAAASRWAERRQRVQDCEQALAAAAVAPERDGRLQELQARESRLQAVQARQQAQRRACLDLETAIAAAEKRRQRDALRAQSERLQQTLSRARAADQGRRAAVAEAGAIPATAESVRALRTACEALERVETRLAAGATRLQAEVNVELRVSGAARPMAPGYQITGEARFELDGVGSITVTAGGRDLAQAQAERERCVAERDRQLTALGATDLDAAEALLESRRAAEARAAEAETLLQALAPEGLSALETAAEETGAALRALGEDQGPHELPEHPQQALQQARDALERIEQELESERRVLAELRERQAAEESRAQALEAQARRLQSQLQQQREAVSDEVLHAAALDAEQRLARAAATRDEAAAAVAGLHPERIELELESAESALRHTADELKGLEAQRTELRTRLDALGHDGLSERAETLRADHARVERQLQALQREADAVWHAWEALDAAAREARETFLGPLTKRLEPYLALLMPEAELTLDDRLTLTGLRRDGREEPFAQLSVGTREQLAIVTRLAFADLLAEHGEPVPVIFDDALVFADEHRFHCMQLVLRLAARRHQVLVLTCRPNDYRDLGARIRRLEAEARERPTA